MQVHGCMHRCILAVECISVVLLGVGVLRGGWFLHRIGISIIVDTCHFSTTRTQEDKGRWSERLCSCQ